MIALLAALALAAPVAGSDAAPPPPKPPASIENAVDVNGVPAWAKRKRLAPVQNCTGRPNIGVETWRQEYERTGRKVRSVPIKTTCKH